MPNLSYHPNTQPNLSELTSFFEAVFARTADDENFAPDQDQALSEWFGINELPTFLPTGQLIEARTATGQLVGAIFIAKQHPLSWPDGRKMELFILGVDPTFRGQGISRTLVAQAEDFARTAGAYSVIVNTHVLLKSVHQVYEKLGYTKLGTLPNYYQNGDAVFFQKKLVE